MVDNAFNLDQSAPSRFARLLSGAQRLECDDDGKQAVRVLPRSNNLPGLSLGYSAATFLVPQILAHEDALVHGRVFIFKSTALAMTSHGILITGKYLNAHFVSVFSFVCMRYEC